MGGAPHRPWGIGLGSAGPNLQPLQPPAPRPCAQPHEWISGPWVGTSGPSTPEDVLDAAALAEERIDHWAAWGHKWRLEEEAEERQHRVEALWLWVCVGGEAHTLAQLSEQCQIQHDGCCQQRILWGGRVRRLRVGGAYNEAPPTTLPPVPHKCCAAPVCWFHPASAPMYTHPSHACCHPHRAHT